MAVRHKKKYFEFERWVDSRQAQGIYWFSSRDALKDFPNKTALSLALVRLSRKGRIARLRKSFYIIIPLEYSNTGVLPPEWFIADLMKYLGQPYYVGLLSAASFYGAAHQRPQEFQVITSRQVRKITFKGLAISFFQKANINDSFITKMKVQTGYMNISTPEATSIDLVHYSRLIGGLDRAATVLKELSEKLDRRKISSAAKAEGDLACAQRLGWLLENKAEFRSQELSKWLSKKRVFPIRLDPSVSAKGGARDNDWRIIVNSEVETDL